MKFINLLAMIVAVLICMPMRNADDHNQRGKAAIRYGDRARDEDIAEADELKDDDIDDDDDDDGDENDDVAEKLQKLKNLGSLEAKPRWIDPRCKYCKYCPCSNNSNCVYCKY